MEYTDTVSDLVIETDDNRWQHGEVRSCLNCGEPSFSRLCRECYRAAFGCGECFHDNGEIICTGFCTAAEDQAKVELERAELSRKVLELLPRHYSDDVQAVVEKIVAGLAAITIGDVWAMAPSCPFNDISKAVKPLIDSHALQDVEPIDG